MRAHSLVAAIVVLQTLQCRAARVDDWLDVEKGIVLLQTDFRLGFGSDSEPQAISGPVDTHAPLAALNPAKFSWVRPPKTGTSIANTFFTWACPLLADDAFVGEHDCLATTPGKCVVRFMEDHQLECKTGFWTTGQHYAMGTPPYWDLPSHSRHFVGYFRQPEQRILTYYESLSENDRFNQSATEFAEKHVGCQVQVVSGNHPDSMECSAGAKLRRQDLNLAIGRLDNEFAYVGIHEERDLSVCLFHTMFGSNVHHRDLVNMTGGLSHGQWRDTSVLEGFVDHVDGELYKHATQIFWANIQKFNVTRMSCESALSQVRHA